MVESKLQDYLNKKAHEYLMLIISEFGNLSIKNDMGEIISNAQQLISNNIIVVENNDNKLQERYKKEGINYETPLAHGGRTFDDGKIHFYPHTLETSSIEEILNKCESTLIHELFHYFIRPQRIDEQNNTNLAGINSFITEGIVDMYARDFMMKHNLFPEYNSKYGRNVLYIRDLLNTQTTNEETKNKIAFNASISDILNISPYSKDFYTKFCKKSEEEKDKDLNVKTPFEIYTYNMIENNVQEEDKKNIPNYYRNIMSNSANFKSTEHAKLYVTTETQKYLQSKHQTISKQKKRVKTLPQNTNNKQGYINIILILISTVIVSSLTFLTILLFQR